MYSSAFSVVAVGIAYRIRAAPSSSSSDGGQLDLLAVLIEDA